MKKNLTSMSHPFPQLKSRRVRLASSIATIVLLAGAPCFSGAELEGLLVLGVIPGETAEKAGVQTGDTIVAIDDQPVTTVAGLIEAFDGRKRGDSINLTLVRFGRPQKIDLVLGEAPGGRVRLGVRLEPTGNRPFQPVVYDKENEFRFEATPKEVCPLFEPDGRRLYDPRWKSQEIYSAESETSEGTVLRVETPFGAGGAIVVFVNSHSPDAMEIRYSILYQSVEIEKYRVICHADEHGGTLATVRTIIMGLSPRGNQAVKNYVEGGSFDESIAAQREAFRRLLAGETLDPEAAKRAHG